MKTSRWRAAWLTVDEASQILMALQNAKVVKTLSGQQRRHIDNAIACLTEFIDRADPDRLEPSPEAMATILRGIAATQAWFEHLFDEFGSVG